MPELKLSLYPKQSQLLKLVEESAATKIGYGGSRGGGKSHGGRNVILIRAMKYPGTRHAIIRRTFEELWDNHLSKLFEQFPFTRGWYNAQHKELTVPTAPSGIWRETGVDNPPSTVKLVYAEHKGDVYKHQGKDWATQLRDESTHFTEEEHVFLDTCARYVGPLPLTPKVIHTMNPGSRGHDYIKRIFIDRSYVGNEKAEQYAFIQSFSWDNCGWFEKELERDVITVKQFYSWPDARRYQYFVSRTDYGAQLNALPETERLQFLHGDWDTFEGQFFSEYRRDLHEVRPFPVPPFWERFAGADWGYSSPACCLWLAVSPDEWFKVDQPNGRQVIIPPRSVVVYRESYVRKLTTPELGAEWCRLSAQEQLRYRIIDPSCQSKEGGVSRIEQLAMAGWQCMPGINSRDNGWSRVRQYLNWRRDQEGNMVDWPHLLIFDTCANLCRTLPKLIHDEIRVEDLDTNGEDHAADALRYALMSRAPITITPPEELSVEYAEAAARADQEEQARASEVTVFGDD